MRTSDTEVKSTKLTINSLQRSWHNSSDVRIIDHSVNQLKYTAGGHKTASRVRTSGLAGLRPMSSWIKRKMGKERTHENHG